MTDTPGKKPDASNVSGKLLDRIEQQGMKARMDAMMREDPDIAQMTEEELIEKAREAQYIALYAHTMAELRTGQQSELRNFPFPVSAEEREWMRRYCANELAAVDREMADEK